MKSNSSTNKDYFKLENYSSEYQTFYVHSMGAGPTVITEILVREEQRVDLRCGVKTMSLSNKI